MGNGNGASHSGKSFKTNVYEKVKTFGIFESRKLRGNVDAPFGLQRFFIYIIIADKFLAQTKL